MKPLRGILSGLLRNDFIQAVTILMSGTFISQLAVVVSTPILTRIYSPEQFGVYAIYSSILLTISILTSLHYETAIPLPKKDKHAFALLMISVMLLICSIIILSLVILLFGKRISIFFQYEYLANYLYLLPASILGLGFFEIFKTWALRKESFRNIAKGKMLMNISQLIPQMGFGFLSGTTIFLIIGDVIGRISGGFSLTNSAKGDMINRVRQVDWKLIKDTALHYKHFPIYLSWSSLFNGVTAHLPTIFIANILGMRVAGLYLIASRILILPYTFIGNSVEQVYYSKASKILHQSFSQLKSLCLETTKKLILLSITIFLFAAVCSPFIFPIVFGNEWKDAGFYVPCMVILFFFQLIAGPTSMNLLLLELLHLQLIVEVLRFILLLGSMFISYYFLSDAWQIILCISIAGAIGFLIKGIFSWYALFSYQKRKMTQNTIQIKQTL